MTGERKKDLVNSALLAGVFMAFGLAFIDRLIGNPAAIV